MPKREHSYTTTEKDPNPAPETSYADQHEKRGGGQPQLHAFRIAEVLPQFRHERIIDAGMGRGQPLREVERGPFPLRQWRRSGQFGQQALVQSLRLSRRLARLPSPHAIVQPGDFQPHQFLQREWQLPFVLDRAVKPQEGWANKGVGGARHGRHRIGRSVA